MPALTLDADPIPASAQTGVKPENFRILILGGGNCGLAIATGLKKAGIQYVVCERDSEEDFYHRPRDWGMLLHWGIDYFAKLLPSHLQNRLDEILCDPHLASSAATAPVPFINSLTGDNLATVPMDGVRRVSRMKIRRFLTSDGDLNVKFNRSAQSLTLEGNTVRVSFQEGEDEIADLVIGCDGSRSKVREFLVGEEAAQPQAVDLTMINFPYTGYTAAEVELLQTRHCVFKIAAHPERPENALVAGTSKARDFPFEGGKESVLEVKKSYG